MAAVNCAHAVPERKNQHYTSTARFSLRPYLPEPYSTPAYAAGLYTTGWMEKVEPSQEWIDHARYYQSVYRKGIYPGFLDAYRAYGSKLLEMLQKVSPGVPFPSDVDISSIGVAENLIQRSYGSDEGGIEVFSISVGTEILARSAVCFVWTFRDQLNLCVVFNQAFHERAQMDDFVNPVKSILMQELGEKDAE